MLYFTLNRSELFETKLKGYFVIFDSVSEVVLRILILSETLDAQQVLFGTGYGIMNSHVSVYSHLKYLHLLEGSCVSKKIWQASEF